MIRAVIVDDEPLGRGRMRFLLESVEDVTVCCEAATSAEVLVAVKQWHPDVLFLDIHLGMKDGFDVVRELTSLGELPLVVFVTAYAQHALDAFGVDAVDYLLKPVQAKRLAEAMRRVRARLAVGPNCLRRFEVRKGSGMAFIEVEQVDFLKADGNYIELHTDGKVELIRVPLSQLVDQLDPREFLRISRSVIVHLPQVSTLEREGRNFAVILKSGVRLRLTRGLSELENRLKFQG